MLSRRHLLAAALLILTALLAGCPRATAPDTMMPDASPVPGQPEEEAAYLPTAEAFVSGLQRGELAEAHALLTEEGRKTLSAEQFATEMQELQPDGYQIASHVATEEAALVMVSFEAVDATAPEALPTSGMTLLLRPVEDGWRVAFFVPQGPPEGGLTDPALTRSDERQWTVTWIGPEGSVQSLILTEFGP